MWFIYTLSILGLVHLLVIEYQLVWQDFLGVACGPLALPAYVLRTAHACVVETCVYVVLSVGVAVKRFAVLAASVNVLIAKSGPGQLATGQLDSLILIPIYVADRRLVRSVVELKYLGFAVQMRQWWRCSVYIQKLGLKRFLLFLFPVSAMASLAPLNIFLQHYGVFLRVKHVGYQGQWLIVLIDDLHVVDVLPFS